MFNPIAIDSHPVAPRRDRPGRADAPARRSAAIELLAVPVADLGGGLRARLLGLHARDAADRGEPLSHGRRARTERGRGAAAAHGRARARAARARGPRERRAGRGPGPRLLARPLEPRSERADAPPRRERAPRRAARGARGLPRALRRAPTAAARAAAARCATAQRARSRRSARTAEARPRHRFARSLSPDPLRAAPVTELLYGRLEPSDVAAVEAALEPAEAALWETADAADRKRLALAFAAHHACEPALERTGLSAAMPPRTCTPWPGAPPRPAAPPTTPTWWPTRSRQSGLRARGRAWPASTSAARRGAWCACWRRPTRSSTGTAATRSRTRSSGRARTCPGSRSSRAPSTRRCPTRTGVRLRLRDLDLEPLRRGRGARLAARDAADRPARRPAAAHDPRRADDRAHPARGRALARAARGDRAARCPSTASGTPPSSARPGDHGVANPDWGTAFLTPEWLLAKLTPRVARGALPARAGSRATRTSTCSSAARRWPSVSVVDPGQGRRAAARRACSRPCARRATLELIVIDSGSRDGSLEIARAAGDELIEIAPARVRPRAHPQPGRRARVGRADLLPHAGRRARSPAGSTPTARRSRSTRAWAPPSARTCRNPARAR